MALDPGLRGEILGGVEQIAAAEWNACFPGEAEAWDYYRACGGPVAAVYDADGLLLAAPIFEMEYRLDTPFQGKAAGVAHTLSRWLPGVMVWRLLGLGSALAERCHVALRPGVSAQIREDAVETLLDLLEQEARTRGARLIAFKDLAAPEADWLAPLLAARRYAAIDSLPVAVLDLTGYRDEADYLARLSPATRKDIRRKLKSRASIRIEHRDAIGDLLPQIEALYASTRDHSQVRYGDFEDLPPGYFASVSLALAGRVRFILYWVGNTLAAFNLLLLEPNRVIDKFLGMAYPLARDHNLYAVSWIENVRFTLTSGRRLLQSGQTAYASKLRFGSGLRPSVNLVRCRGRLLNLILHKAAPWLAFDRWDPDLKAHAKREPPP